jgi:hypothetical protein
MSPNKSKKMYQAEKVAANQEGVLLKWRSRTSRSRQMTHAKRSFPGNYAWRASFVANAIGWRSRTSLTISFATGSVVLCLNSLLCNVFHVLSSKCYLIQVNCILLAYLLGYIARIAFHSSGNTEILGNSWQDTDGYLILDLFSRST